MAPAGLVVMAVTVIVVEMAAPSLAGVPCRSQAVPSSIIQLEPGLPGAAGRPVARVEPAVTPRIVRPAAMEDRAVLVGMACMAGMVVAFMYIGVHLL